MVKNRKFTFLLTSSGQEWQFHIVTNNNNDTNNNGNFLFLLTFSGEG